MVRQLHELFVFSELLTIIPTFMAFERKQGKLVITSRDWLLESTK